MSGSRRAVGRWRAAVAGVVLAVSPLAVAACGSGDDSVQQTDGNEDEADEDEPDEDEPDGDEPDEG
ncbi:hypothetical protein JD79_03201 [Geodermatophilus normandii]|uniref:Uncharacterized protein n=1 Tax=Geodermatophilus normandii TaxID=1137989 RepID=A0A317QM77_9ACTN|nr:hypothetical protein [Geodermatophilus normandii]PWW24024.1 hypothetical protein JD79_03201 [Geodermatophilus normandii]